MANNCLIGILYRFSGLIEVARELEKLKDDNIKLLILGKEDLWDDLQNMRGKNGLDKKIIMGGWKPYEEIPKYLAASDICILPAHKNEIMMNIVPIKMYEYMAAGKPVIATKLPVVMKEFGTGNGVVYVDDAEDVMHKAIELSENGSMAEIGVKARQCVLSNDWNTITDTFEKSLGEVICVR